MNKETLLRLFQEYEDKDYLEWVGTCHDCGEPVTVTAIVVPEGDGIEITGGVVYDLRGMDTVDDDFILKCDACFGKEKNLANFQPCEVYSRCVGYIRPVKQFNPGKQAEYGDRKMFDMDWDGFEQVEKHGFGFSVWKKKVEEPESL